MSLVLQVDPSTNLHHSRTEIIHPEHYIEHLTISITCMMLQNSKISLTHYLVIDFDKEPKGIDS
jgi:hypothetical protein